MSAKPSRPRRTEPDTSQWSGPEWRVGRPDEQPYDANGHYHAVGHFQDEIAETMKGRATAQAPSTHRPFGPKR